MINVLDPDGNPLPPSASEGRTGAGRKPRHALTFNLRWSGVVAPDHPDSPARKSPIQEGYASEAART